MTGQVAQNVTVVGHIVRDVNEILERVADLITAAVKQAVDGFTVFVLVLAKEIAGAVGEGVVELLEGVGRGGHCLVMGTTLSEW